MKLTGGILEKAYFLILHQGMLIENIGILIKDLRGWKNQMNEISEKIRKFIEKFEKSDDPEKTSQGFIKILESKMHPKLSQKIETLIALKPEMARTIIGSMSSDDYGLPPMSTPSMSGSSSSGNLYGGRRYSSYDRGSSSSLSSHSRSCSSFME